MRRLTPEQQWDRLAEYWRSRSCTGKRRFTSQEQADANAARIREFKRKSKRAQRNDHRFEGYKCVFCGYFHIGHGTW